MPRWQPSQIYNSFGIMIFRIVASLHIGSGTWLPTQLVEQVRHVLSHVCVLSQCVDILITPHLNTYAFINSHSLLSHCFMQLVSSPSSDSTRTVPGYQASHVQQGLVSRSSSKIMSAILLAPSTDKCAVQGLLNILLSEMKKLSIHIRYWKTNPRPPLLQAVQQYYQDWKSGEQSVPYTRQNRTCLAKLLKRDQSFAQQVCLHPIFLVLSMSHLTVLVCLPDRSPA